MKWIIELQPGQWLFGIYQNGVYAMDHKEAALPRPSKRSAQRALQRARKRAGQSYPNAKIHEVTE